MGGEVGLACAPEFPTLRVNGQVQIACAIQATISPRPPALFVVPLIDGAYDKE